MAARVDFTSVNHELGLPVAAVAQVYTSHKYKTIVIMLLPYPKFKLRWQVVTLMLTLAGPLFVQLMRTYDLSQCAKVTFSRQSE